MRRAPGGDRAHAAAVGGRAARRSASPHVGVHARATPIPRARAGRAAAHRRAARGARAARAAAGPAAGPVAARRRSPRAWTGSSSTPSTCPNAANGEIKPETLAAVRAGLAARAGPRVLCGDLNTPRREQPDGTVWSFARDGRGRLREERAGFWDEAELGVVPGPARARLRRRLPRAARLRARATPSWTWRRISGHGGGWRLDHVFSSAELRAVGLRLPPRVARRRAERPLGAGGRHRASLKFSTVRPITPHRS